MKSARIEGWGRVLVALSDGEIELAEAQRLVAAIANDEEPPDVSDVERGGILGLLEDFFG